MRYVLFLSLGVLAGCAQVQSVFGRSAPAENAEPVIDAEVADTVTTETADAADAVPVSPTAVAARTVVALGDPSRSGLWLETPLVSAGGSGQVRYAGKVITVNLIPIDAPATAGSRMSLDAMRALGTPLTELTEVEVIAG